jgi:hypothetical protein
VNSQAHPVSWRAVDELPELTMFKDTRQIGAVLFSCIELVVADQAERGEILRVFASAGR